MSSVLALLFLFGVPELTPRACEEARADYDALQLEVALLKVENALKTFETRPLTCLLVKALAHTVLGQMDEATEAFEEIFRREPDYAVADPSLSPSLQQSIERIRESVRALSAHTTADWIVHESLRIDVVLQGGLRDASRIRFFTETAPDFEQHQGEIPLIGRAATATVSVSARTRVDRIRFRGVVLNPQSDILHEFKTDLSLRTRPVLRDPEKIIVPVESSSTHWGVWVGMGVVAIGAGIVIAILAQPVLPDTDGTLGRVPISP